MLWTCAACLRWPASGVSLSSPGIESLVGCPSPLGTAVGLPPPVGYRGGVACFTLALPAAVAATDLVRLTAPTAFISVRRCLRGVSSSSRCSSAHSSASDTCGGWYLLSAHKATRATARNARWYW